MRNQSKSNNVLFPMGLNLNKIVLPVYPPRRYQLSILNAFDRGIRRLIISWHRRAGKDLICFSIMVREAMKTVGTYYYYFPTLEDGKKILWNNVTTINGKSGTMVDLLCPPEIAKKNNSEYYIKLINGSMIFIGGTDNLKVIGLDGIGYVYSEWQGQKPEAFELVRPILRQNNGWVIFNGTMRGKENHLFKDIQRNKGLKGWFCEWLLPKVTKAYYWISPEDEDEEYKIRVNPELEGKTDPETGRPYTNIQDEVDSGMSYARARQEYLNEAVSDYPGAYFGYELQVMRRKGAIGHFGGMRKGLPVSTSWDIGLDDSMAITLVQDINGKKRIVGYIEESGKLYEYFFKELRKLGVKFAGFYVPHDAKRRSGETLRNFVVVAEKAGFRVRAVPKTNSVRDDIEICRQQWKDWEIDLDGVNVELLNDHLTKYRENPRTGRPDHSDDSSNGGDSVRTIMMAIHRKMYDEFMDSEVEDTYYDGDDGDEIEDDYPNYSLD